MSKSFIRTDTGSALAHTLFALCLCLCLRRRLRLVAYHGSRHVNKILHLQTCSAKTGQPQISFWLFVQRLCCRCGKLVCHSSCVTVSVCTICLRIICSANDRKVVSGLAWLGLVKSKLQLYELMICGLTMEFYLNFQCTLHFATSFCPLCRICLNRYSYRVL